MRITCLLLVLWAIPIRSPGAPLDEAERDKKIDEALSHYYNGRPESAKNIAEELRQTFPTDPFFYELLAEIIMLELERKTTPNSGPKDKEVDHELVKQHQSLVEQFHEKTATGLAYTQQSLKVNPSDSKHIFLRGMLLSRLAAFTAKFEGGGLSFPEKLKVYQKADEHAAEAIRLLKKAMELDPSLHSAKYVLALTKYLLIKRADESILENLGIRWKSQVYVALGSNYDISYIFTWLRESMNYNSVYYFTKDIEIDKKMVYQGILTLQAGKMDQEILPVLQELNQRFPDNVSVRDNLFLVNLHIANKKR